MNTRIELASSVQEFIDRVDDLLQNNDLRASVKTFIIKSMDHNPADAFHDAELMYQVAKKRFELSKQEILTPNNISL